jgi:uncharacterized membrane protein
VRCEWLSRVAAAFGVPPADGSKLVFQINNSISEAELGNSQNPLNGAGLNTHSRVDAFSDFDKIYETGATMVNPFDLKAVLLEKHAQHVVLIHFPIALFIAAVAFDLIALWTKRRGLADAAYYNLLAAAISTLPVIVTGLLAWQFQLEGQKLKGVLLLHLVLACVSTAMIWLVWWVHFRARRRTVYLPTYRLAVEFLALVFVALTAHLGGFLSGVNTPG